MSRAEAQARRLLWVFPGWLRATRGEEAVGLVLDLLAPGADRLPLRSKLDLVRAGLHARRRGTPPPSVWWRVVNAHPSSRGGMVPDRWRPWLLHQLRRRWFTGWCAFLAASYPMALSVVYLLPWSGGSTGELDAGSIALVPATGVLVAVLWLVVRRPGWRRALYARNGCDHRGIPLPPHQRQLAWTVPGLTNVLLLPLVAGFIAASAAIAIAGFTGSADDRPVVTSAAAALASTVGLPLLLAGLVHLRLRRVVRLGAGAPSEHLERGEWVLAVILGALAGGPTAAFIAPVLFVAAGWGRLVAVGVALGGCLAALVVRRHARRLGRPLGLWDLVPVTAPRLQLISVETPPAEDRPARGGPWSAA